ncbi:MAG: LPS assembly lipoprotein LptE [Gemmatimonadota bacterium]
MKSSRFQRISGTRARERGRASRRSLAVLAAAVAFLGGCTYGFQGGGFPSHIRTIYIAPFENETPQFDLDTRLYSALLDELPGSLGLRVAGEESADAILRGAILRYDDVAQNYRSGAQQPAGNVLSHEVQIGISAELVDVRDNVIRWEARSLTGRGSYDPTSEQDAAGQRNAIENLIEQIIDGAQSQW